MSEGFVDLTSTAETVVFATALTGAPPGTYLRTLNLSLRYLRACTIDDEAVTARGRILHAGSSFTTVEVLIDDVLGRAVAHATGSVVIRPMDPLPPPMSRPLEPVEEPVYTTPDPPHRPVSGRVSRNWEMMESPEETTTPLPTSRRDPLLPPLAELFGIRVLDASVGAIKATMPTTEWFCRMYREVAPGVIGILSDFVSGTAIGTIAQADERFLVINVAYSFITPIVPNGRHLAALGTVRHRADDALLLEGEVADATGRVVAVAQANCLLTERRGRRGQRPADRVLLTVLFTDLVGSSEWASQLGDVHWRELLDEHNRIVRRQLELFKGREVKTTGDGFLTTFDSPTHAVQCARAIRHGVNRLGLEFRAGIHTGECDVTGGDVAGVAVHVASRVQSTANPGEILISHTVRDLISQSGLQASDRGLHKFKGLEGKWPLFAVED
jgi:class 3 adenylate cyclase